MHHFVIAGKKWLWKYTRLKGRAEGWAYIPEGRGTGKVLIDNRLKNRVRLEVELHEALHCIFPQMSEQTITEGAKDLSKVLWHLGYRL
jgi:hypothetical protein